VDLHSSCKHEPRPDNLTFVVATNACGCREPSACAGGDNHPNNWPRARLQRHRVGSINSAGERNADSKSKRRNHCANRWTGACVERDKFPLATDFAERICKF
jgi:hypothetical protein